VKKEVSSISHVFFAGDHRLEGMLEWPSPTGPRVAVADDGRPQVGEKEAAPAPNGGVVVAHPHPLYGGTMAQPVVFRVAKACRERGFVTFRFNFRGVGASAGAYDGREEYRDVEAALAYLRGQLAAGREASNPTQIATFSSGSSGVKLGLAGYSFGSVMASVAAGRGGVPVEALALIALPVAWPELPADFFRTLERFGRPVLAVCGEADDLAPPDEVASTLEGLGIDFRLEVVAGSGHLFEGRQHEVGEIVGDFFASVLGRLSTR